MFQCPWPLVLDFLECWLRSGWCCNSTSAASPTSGHGVLGLVEGSGERCQCAGGVPYTLHGTAGCSGTQ
jgi:hypothetical protein